jgi:hypothetical protein
MASEDWTELDTKRMFEQVSIGDQDSRADAIMGIMLDGRWEGRRTVAMLAKSWGIARTLVEQDARVAMRAFSPEAGEREMLRSEFCKRIRAIALGSRSRRSAWRPKCWVSMCLS